MCLAAVLLLFFFFKFFYLGRSEVQRRAWSGVEVVDAEAPAAAAAVAGLDIKTGSAALTPAL